MAKNNAGLIILGVVLTVLVLAGIGVGIYFAVGISAPQSVLPTDSVLCPDGKSCTATAILKCTNTQPNTQVILRTNSPTWNAEDFDNTGTMVALDDNGDGSLSGFVRSSTTSTCLKDSSSSNNLFKSLNIGIDFIYVYNHELYICTSSSKAYQYAPTTLIPASLSHVEGWNEKFSGNLYSCSRTVKIDSQIKETITWGGSTPTPSSGKRGSTYSLMAGQRLTTEGTGTSEIDFIVGDIPITTCTTSSGSKINIGDKVCIDKYTKEECVAQLNANPKIAQTLANAQNHEICRGGEIVPAYTVVTDIEKSVISSEEQWKINFELKDTPTNKDISVVAKILKGNQQMDIKTQGTGDSYPDVGKTTFVFDAQPVGNYILRISFTHPDGNYVSQDYPLKVSEGVLIEVKADNPVQFDSQPIQFYILASQSGSPKALDGYPELDVKYNGIKLTSWIKSIPTLGKYLYQISNLKGDGDLVIKARGYSGGLQTEWTDDYTVKVKTSTILFSSVVFPTDVCTGSYEGTFETKDSNGNYLQTSNSVTIIKPAGGSDVVSATEVEKGKYKFSYNYASAGIYTIKVTSTSQTIGSSQLNNGNGQSVNMLGGATCGDGGGGGTNWTMYLIIGGFIVGIIVFIWLVFFRKKK